VTEVSGQLHISDAFTVRESNPRAHRIGEYLGPIEVLDVIAKRHDPATSGI